MSHWYRCITICTGVLQRGHPLPMTDTVFAQGKQKRACPHATKAVVFKTGYEHKQTLTNNQSCQRKSDAVLHALHNFTADDAIAPAKWSFKIESCIFSPAKCSSIFRSCIFRNIGPANSGPAFSGPPFSALPDGRHHVGH